MMKNILIIDDNPLVTKTLTQNISWHSLDCTVTHTLNDALPVMDLLKTETVDIIIADIQMPGLSGLEMSRQVLLSYPFTKIILISAYEDFQYVQEAIRLGVYDYIEKPINNEYLYQIISKACQQIDLDHKIQRQLTASKPALREKFFLDILRCSAKEAAYYYREYPEFLDISIESKYHLCVYIKIPHSGSTKLYTGIRKFHTDLLAFENSLLRIFEDFTLCHLVHNGNSLILILGQTTDSPESFLNYVETFLTGFLTSGLNFNPLFGIGNVITSFWNIRQSWENAKLALEYSFFTPEENPIRFDDISRKPFTLDLNLERKSEKIIQFICQNQKDNLQEYLNQFYEEISTQTTNKNSLFFSITEIAWKILNFLHKMGLDPAHMNNSLIPDLGNTRQFSTSRALIDWLYQLCVTACDELNSSISHYQKRMAIMADQYMQAHYSDSGLSLNELAQHIHVSPVHLSATYKKQTGQTITDALSHIRISQAQDMLANTNLTIREISEKAGFSNQFYFSACFKKITGQPPSSFRSMTGQER